ncbi:MAG TPA: hypothetical protein PLJ38_08480 [bacterium]|nr:hypothetical protein [bacterium]
MKKILLIVAIISLLSVKQVSAALYSDLQLGARSSAMGSAYVSVAREADAVYWNPAALAMSKKSNVSFMHSDVFGIGIKQSYLSYAQPLDFVGIGASWLRHSADLAEGFGATSKINSWVDDALMLSIGMKAKSDIYAGLSMKRYKVKTKNNVGTSGLGFDFGLLFTDLYKKNDNVKNIDFGVQIRNIATDLSNENVDPSYKLGMSCRILDDFIFAVGMDIDNDNPQQTQKTRLNLGLEYGYNNTLFVRLGSNDGDFTTGFGLKFQEKLSLDYAFEKSLGDLNKDNHRFSLSFWF